MELKECITCGSHSFTGNKCDYCGNQYEVQDSYDDDNYAEREMFYDNDFIALTEREEVKFEETPEGKSLLKAMFWVLISIIWFAVCVFIPPLFLITICGLIIWVCRKICKKY